MIGILNESQINNLLVSQSIGRLGCINKNHPYIIPVTYTFDGTNIYGQLQEGSKLNFMRENPKICFQVDLIVNSVNWQSVLVEGQFQELGEMEANEARRNLYERVFPLLTSSTVHAHEHQVLTEDVKNSSKPVMYRVLINKKTGKFEKQ